MAAPRIHHLNCGTMCPVGRRLLNGDGGLLASARLVCHVLLIEGPDGLVLVDTGLGTGDVRDPGQLGRPFTTVVRPRLTEAETAAAQVRALGFDPADVRQVVLTHLDLDHAGGLPDFPAAEVHVFAPELEAAMNPRLSERQRYVATHWAHGPRWVTHNVEGDEWLGFESVRVMPVGGSEILLIPLTGHTRGHTGVAIRRAERWLLHCGDAYFHRGEVLSPPHCPAGLRLYEELIGADGARRRANQERLRELAQRHPREVELICSHDAVELETALGGSSG